MRVLLISIAFPPKRDPECIQTARYFKYLSSSKTLELHVLTSNRYETLFMPYDEFMDKAFEEPSHIQEFYIQENRYLSALINRVFPVLNNLPDSKASFIRQVRSNIGGINDHDVLYSRSNPISSSIAAYHVKARFNKPWVMHLSDPWTLSPLHEFKGYSKAFHEKWESLCFNTADQITFTSALTKDLYIKKYPLLQEKFSILPNVFDPDMVIPLSTSKGSRKIRIVHTGGMVGSRNPGVFIQALEALSESERQKIEVYFAGDADRNSREMFKRSSHLIRFLGPVSLDRAEDLQRNADILLLIDNEFSSPEDAVFFPSKLLDYMVKRAHILAITCRGGTTHQVIKNIGGHAYEHTDWQGIRDFLRSQIQTYKEPVSQKPPKEYSAEYNAKKLIGIFESLC